MTGKTYKGGSDFLSNLFSGIFDFISHVFGFTGTFEGPMSAPDIEEPVIPIIADNNDKIELGRAVLAEIAGPESAIIMNECVPLIQEYKQQSSYIANKGQVVMVEAQSVPAQASVMQGNPATFENDIILGVDENTEKSMQKMVNAINKVGNWYVNHVVTYETEERLSNATEEAKEYYDFLNNNASKYINSADSFLYKPENMNRWYYRVADVRPEYENDNENRLLTRSYIKAKEYEVYYTDGTQAFDNNDNEEYRRPLKDNNSIQRYGGDDCTGFMMAVFEYATGALFKRKKIVGEPDRMDLKYENIDTPYIFSHINLFGDWMYEMAKVKLYKASEISELRPGDCLLTDGGGGRGGHAEFYVDDNHTFGWGNVWGEYLRERTTYMNGDGYSFSGTGDLNDTRVYSYVLRYIGG